MDGDLDGRNVLVVIPARNESGSVQSVVESIRQRGNFTILVVDDFSDDDTSSIAREAGADVLSLPFNLGAWGAMQTGIRYGADQKFCCVVTIDADGQHDPAFISDLIAPLKSGEADVVIGACPERGSLARRIAWAYFRRLTGFAVEDLTSGFRAYSGKAIELLAGDDATLVDYQDLGILLLLRNAGLRIREVPVTMSPRVAGKSRIFSSWWKILRYMAETTIICIAYWRIGGRRAS